MTLLPFAIPLSQLEGHLWESANILRGPVDADSSHWILQGVGDWFFAPDHDPCPTRHDGSIEWSNVTIISIEYIGDYHD